MDRGTRESILEWLKAHRGRLITVRASGTALSVTGVCEGVEELDACSAEFQSSGMTLGVDQSEVSLTFHESALSLHVLLRHPDSGRTVLSAPLTIPYEEAILEVADTPPAAEAPTSAEEGESEDAARSPYRLLH